MRKALKISLCVIALGLLAIGGLFVAAIRSMDGETIQKTHVASVDWLPKEATDITYIIRNGLFWYRSYECTMSNSVFQEFSRLQKWDTKEVKDYSTALRHDLGLAPVRTFEGTPMDYYPRAFVYENRKPNGGGVTVIFDATLERLFVNESTN